MTLSTLFSAALIINELMASNIGTAMSPATNFNTWIEIYNPSDQDVDLAGWYLSDNADIPTLWHMPQDMGKVPAKGFKVIWMGSNNIKQDQAPFELSCDGGTVFLSDPSGQLVTSETYPEAISRTAYARTTDGAEEWGWTAQASPGKSNNNSTFSNRRVAAPIVNQDSQIFTSSLKVKVDIPEGTTLVYTTDGSVPEMPQQIGEDNQWTNYIKNGDCEGDDVTCLVGKDGDMGGQFETHIFEGVGFNNSRGIKVHAIKNPSQDWDTQFFVYTPDHVWKPGEQFRFKMKVRADKATHISVQSHSQPGDYIHWQMLDNGYNITTEWQDIYYEGKVTDQQAGGGFWGESSRMQTIAFNLNEMRESSNNFYFDDISWESFNGQEEESSGKVSVDGQFTINNTTNFCFRLFQEGWLPSVPVTRSYIKTNHEYTIPVISIVGNRKYFDDNIWGIDTRGTNGRTGNGQSSKCNFNMDWDRPVNFSMITPDGKMVYNQDVEISVSGGWTRSATPRSFKLKASKEFDGKNTLDYTFFPQKPYLRNKVLLLRNGGNDVWENGGSRFMDPALQTIIQRSGINLDLQSYVPIIEYVNGEFRGVLNMREPNNKKFVESNFGYDDKKIDMFEMSADSNVVFMVGNSAVLERIYELGALAPDNQAYQELKNLLDIDEFINYMAIELFLGSNDWPHNNIKGFRSQDNGRYRFVTFDLDYAFKYDDPFKEFANDQWHTFNFIYDTQESRYEEIKIVTFFLNMLRNDEFRKQFIDTYCIIGGSVFEKERSIAIVDELADRVRPMMQLEGWRSPDGSANLIRTKLNTQNESMMTCMQQFKQMQLTGVKKQKVNLNANVAGAKIFINGIEVPYSDFKGQLFAPVRLDAQAPAGYSFAGWKKGNASTYYSTESSINLPTDNIVNLTACFVKLSEEQRLAEGITPIRINEVSAANDIYVNEYWKRNDWLELFNTTDQPIDVEGMYISDNKEKPHKYQISKAESTASTIIPPHGYLIIWCDKLEPVSQLHASFKLDADGGDVLLTATDDSWCDQLTYTSLKEDESAGRYPDGSNDVFVMNVPTIAKTNIKTCYSYDMPQIDPSGIGTTFASNKENLKVNYAAGSIIIRSNNNEPMKLTIYNMAGQCIMQQSTNLFDGYAEVRLPNIPDGCYTAHITDSQGHQTACKFIHQ